MAMHSVQKWGSFILRGKKIQNVPVCYKATSTAPQTTQIEERPQMPSCDYQPAVYTGPSYEEVLRIKKDHCSPALVPLYKKPLLMHDAHMQWVFDHEGKRYLDCFGGAVTISLGHSHPKVQKAIQDQSKKIWHCPSLYLNPNLYEFVERLTSTLPGNLKVAYIVNSGSEANDLALLMAKLYTGRFEILGLRNAYHGTSLGTQGLMGMNTWKYNAPLNFGIHQTMNPDPYRGLWGGANCRDSLVQTDRSCDCPAGKCLAEDMYVDQFEETIKHSIPREGLAGFFAETIQGSGGCVQFPKGFIRRAFELVRGNGGLCISDEVQTAFGRTGDHYWGFEGHGVVPDIVTTAKSIGNGIPLAAVITTPEIAATLNHAATFNTYGGNPISCAVGNAVLQAVEEENLQQRCKEVGTYFIKQLSTLRDEFEIVGDVRGKGLYLGIDFVSSKETREPLNASAMSTIMEACKEMGVLFGKGNMKGNVFRAKPPMCFTYEDADFTVAVLRSAIQHYLTTKDSE